MCTQAQRFLWLFCNSLVLIAQKLTRGSDVHNCGTYCLQMAVERLTTVKEGL